MAKKIVGHTPTSLARLQSVGKRFRARGEMIITILLFLIPALYAHPAKPGRWKFA